MLIKDIYVWFRSLEIILILIIVLIFFGAGKLPKVAGEIAKGIKSFKEGLKDDKKEKINAKYRFD